MGRVLPLAPLNLVNFLLDLQRFKVIELRLVRLELGVEFVLASLFLRWFQVSNCWKATRALVLQRH